MSQAQFTIPLITVIPGQLITAALWNNEWTNVGNNMNPLGVGGYEDTDTQMQIQTPPYPGSVTSHASSVAGELERIRYQLAQILGTDYWYKPAATNLTSVNDVVVPVGGVIDFPTDTPPNSNWLLANGQAIGRTAYASLFSLIGTTFGVGDGANTFNLPNYTDVMSIGAGNLYAAAATGGAISSTPTISITDPKHNHTQNSHGHGLDMGTYNSGAGGVYLVNSNFSHYATATNIANSTGITAASTAVPTLPPYLGMYKMVRVL